MTIPIRCIFWVIALTFVFLNFSRDGLNYLPAQSITFQSGPEQVSLIEQFTSEGCASCPPSDEWVSGLKSADGIWKKYIPVSFHVDYWDRLGWRDRYSTRAFTQRQYTYSSFWKSKQVYTPAFAINGREWKNWSPEKAVPVSDHRPGILKVEAVSNHVFTATFEPSDPEIKQWRAVGVLLGFNIQSPVSAGENAGKNLKHDFVVLDFQDRLMEKTGGKFMSPLELKPPPGVRAPRYGVAVWITRDNDLIPAQVTGGYLSQS